MASDLIAWPQEFKLSKGRPGDVKLISWKLMGFEGSLPLDGAHRSNQSPVEAGGGWTVAGVQTVRLLRMSPTEDSRLLSTAGPHH